MQTLYNKEVKMFTNCTIKTKQDLKDRFGSFANALSVGNKYRDEPLTMRQLGYQLKNKKLTAEWQAFWSNVAFYEQRQGSLFGETNDC
jgi:hypothetical protein